MPLPMGMLLGQVKVTPTHYQTGRVGHNRVSCIILCSYVLNLSTITCMHVHGSPASYACLVPVEGHSTLETKVLEGSFADILKFIWVATFMRT